MSGLIDKLSVLNTKHSISVNLDRLTDTIAMIIDESDPHGQEFLTMFLNECDKDLTLIKKTNDRVAISKICHKFIGRSSQLGFIGLEGLVQDLQLWAKEDTETTGPVQSHIFLIERELEKLKQVIQPLWPAAKEP